MNKLSTKSDNHSSCDRQKQYWKCIYDFLCGSPTVWFDYNLGCFYKNQVQIQPWPVSSHLCPVRKVQLSLLIQLFCVHLSLSYLRTQILYFAWERLRIKTSCQRWASGLFGDLSGGENAIPFFPGFVSVPICFSIIQLCMCHSWIINFLVIWGVTALSQWY